MSAVEDRLAELGLSVPEVVAPLAAYVPAVISGSYVYTSGQLPMVAGVLQATGRLGAEIDVDRGADLAQMCALNAIAAIKSVIGDLDRTDRGPEAFDGFAGFLVNPRCVWRARRKDDEGSLWSSRTNLAVVWVTDRSNALPNRRSGFRRACAGRR